MEGGQRQTNLYSFAPTFASAAAKAPLSLANYSHGSEHHETVRVDLSSSAPQTLDTAPRRFLDLILDKDARDGKGGKDGPYIGDILTRALFVEIFLEGENTHEAKCAAVARATKLSTRMSAALAKVPAREHNRAIHNLVTDRVTSKLLDRCVAVMR